MSTSRIEELIEDIYEFIEDCKMQPLSSTKVIVPKDELYDLLDELRMRTPDEIKHFRKMLSNKDAILADAEAKAQEMLREAQAQTDALVNEHEIMQQAYEQADTVVKQAMQQAEQILASAHHDADQIRQGAIGYTSDMLTGLENILEKAYQDSRIKYEGLIGNIKENMDIVHANHRELVGDVPASAQEPVVQAQEQQDGVKHDEEPDGYALPEDYYTREQN